MLTFLLLALGCGCPDPGPSASRATTPTCETLDQSDAKIYKIDDDIYIVHAKGKSTVPNKTITFVVTDDGVVVFDAGNEQSAAVSKAYIRTITDKPIKYVVYSHHHGTGIQGTPAIVDEGTRIIAHEDFPTEIRWTKDLERFNRRLNNIQFNLNIDPDRPLVDPMMPDITYATDYAFELGGTRFELFHVEGEARDYTVMWLPDRKIAWIADLATKTFPMVASPMKPVREPLRWKAALDRVAALEPNVLVNSVDPPYCDGDTVQALLGEQSAILGFVHDSVVEQMNLGATVDEAVARIKLPPELAQVPQLYGSLEFSVRGVFELYSGWFDQNGSHLRPPLRRDLAASYVETMGGPDKVFAEAQKFVAEDRLYMALQYLDLLIDSGQEARAWRLKSEILQSLSKQKTPNMVLRSMYAYLAREAGAAADKASGVPPNKGGKAGKAGKAPPGGGGGGGGKAPPGAGTKAKAKVPGAKAP